MSLLAELRLEGGQVWQRARDLGLRGGPTVEVPQHGAGPDEEDPATSGAARDEHHVGARGLAVVVTRPGRRSLRQVARHRHLVRHFARGERDHVLVLEEHRLVEHRLPARRKHHHHLDRGRRRREQTAAAGRALDAVVVHLHLGDEHVEEEARGALHLEHLREAGPDGPLQVGGGEARVLGAERELHLPGRDAVRRHVKGAGNHRARVRLHLHHAPSQPRSLLLRAGKQDAAAAAGRQ
mmetsp:Transcript_15037/g.30280  ORF Transcript_15037/g.30280 Transcript_15037/m.30280 type:complete len:238 (-) Transcript_15037:158-871(-)